MTDENDPVETGTGRTGRAEESVQGPYQTHLAEAAAADQLDGSTRNPALLDLKARWAALNARQKLRAKQLGVAASVAVLGYGLYTASTANHAQPEAAPAASKLDMGAGLRGDSLETKLRGDLKKVLDGQSLLGERITAIEEGKVVPGSKPPGVTDGGELPAALPGAAPSFPPSPDQADIDSAAGTLPAPPTPPAAPPAPPVEKTFGAIGAATSAIVPAAGNGQSAAADGAKKTYGPPRLQGRF